MIDDVPLNKRAYTLSNQATTGRKPMEVRNDMGHPVLYLWIEGVEVRVGEDFLVRYLRNVICDMDRKALGLPISPG